MRPRLFAALALTFLVGGLSLSCSSPSEGALPGARAEPALAEDEAPPEASPKLDAATLREALDEAKELSWPKRLERLYDKGRPLLFAGPEGLTPRGARVLARLREAESEGIDPAPLKLDAVDAAIEPAAKAPITQATLELRVTDALLTWADHFGPHPLEGASPPAEGAGDAELLSRLSSASSAAEVDAVLERVEPPDPRYRPLVAARVRYWAIVERGGWPTKAPRIKRPKGGEAEVFKPGFKRYPEHVVTRVKARLAGEGLYTGDVEDESWDDALSDALRRYRANNLLGEGPYIDYQTVQAMKVPAAFRLAQIDLNLERIRRTRFGSSDYYVYVNIPRYVAEVYDGGDKKLEFGVVTGSRKKFWDKEREAFGFPDATPLLVEKMEKVIFSPTWMVPGRARVQLRRKAKGKPDFWKKNGYELLPGPNGGLIRQNPGPDNALGLVKFLFPNNDDIYMHDTNRKDLFQETVRAFSHGCIRVEKPLELAQYVLSREDPSWTERKVRLAAKSGSTNPQALENGPDVFLEYITVHPAEGGEVQFLWDIYHRDVAEIAAKWKIEVETSSHYP